MSDAQTAIDLLKDIAKKVTQNNALAADAFKYETLYKTFSQHLWFMLDTNVSRTGDEFVCLKCRSTLSLLVPHTYSYNAYTSPYDGTGICRK